MDSYGQLKLSWSIGYNCSPLHFIDDTTLVYASGNSLTFLRTTGEIVCSTPSHGTGVGPIAVCKEAQTLAYAETTLRPLIFLTKYPGNSIESTLKGRAKLEYTHLAFSKNGRQLASLSGVPDFLLTIWDCSGGEVLCETSVGPGGTSITFNPLNWKQVSLIGSRRATLWTLEQCGPQTFQSPIEIRLPERTCPVGTSEGHDDSATKTAASAEHKSSTKVENVASEGTLFAVPDLTSVLYTESYDEFIATRELVIPESQCWGSQQSVYIGCKGGQVLMVDSESGLVTVLANPQIIKEDEPGEEETSEGPQTGHAVLGEGCAQVVGVSKRGLFAGGQSGVVWCFDLANNLKALDSWKDDSAIISLALSPSCDKLAVGTSKGDIHVLDSSHLSTASCVAKHGYSAITGVDVLTPGTLHCVTCRAEGFVQVWEMQNGKQVSTLRLPYQCSTLVCPISSSTAVVGTAKGSLCVISLVDPLHPKMVLARCMHPSAITALRCDQYGRFMASLSRNGSVLVYKGSPSTKCAVLGYTDVSGDLLELSVLATGLGDEDETIFGVLSQDCNKTAITVFQIPNISSGQAVPELCEDVTYRLSALFTSKREFTLEDPVCGFSLLSASDMVAIVRSTKMLAKFSLPPTGQKVQKLTPQSTHSSHELAGGITKLSLNQKLLGSVAPDGKLMVRLPDNLDRPLQLSCHHHSRGGCDGLAFSSDSRRVFTTGDSGTLSCWEWELTTHGSAKATQASEYNTKLIQRLESIQTAENIALSSMTPLPLQAAEKEEDTKQWLQCLVQKADQVEDEKYSEGKAKLRQELSSLREKVMTLITTNEQLPAIEQLERREFILDTEEHKRLQAEEDAFIQKVREEIELSNLTKMYLRDKIKQKCWDSMKVKGKVVKAFQSKLEVRNYALIFRSEATLKELERVKLHRKIELAEQEIRRLVSRPDPGVAGMEDHGGTGEEEPEGKQEVKEQGDPDALKGSHGSRYGGECELLHDQFELYSLVSKKQQICLLQDCIYRIKETFNKEFDEVSKAKEGEIARIMEKNTRIRKIVRDLKLSESVTDPTLDPAEQPESFLTVQDSEIKAEKYIPPEEQKRLQEAALAEEKKRLAEIGDNPRERALEMMMYGRLEANAEEELFKDLVRPDFMQKDPAEMSEDEIRMGKEFEKKEAAFLEEREKLKKALEAEFKKLQGSIVQSMEQFDERLHKLFELKIRTETAVLQEELKILRLVLALMMEEEVAIREEELNQELERKKVVKAETSSAVSMARRHVDDYREVYDRIQAEDREMDKTFKKDFADCEPYLDQLYKLYRKRPRGQRLKSTPSEGAVVQEASSQNPFAERPPSSSLGRGGGGAQGGQPLDDVMGELDHPSNMPEGLSHEAWERLVVARRKKVESEQKVKVIALKLAEMTAFLKKRQAEDESIQNTIQETFRQLNKLQEDKMVFDLNLEVQFLLKQGQIEVDPGEFVPDFSDSVLIHRSAVEELNSQIKSIGEAKLSTMTEAKDFKKGIYSLKWELKKLLMMEEDLIEKGKDIQMLKVTKELQQRLMDLDHSQEKDQRDISALESALELTEKTHHNNVQEKKRILAKYQSQVEAMECENKNKEKELLELWLDVQERKGIDKLAGLPAGEVNRERRMNEIVTRRKMVDLVKSQAQEVTVLRAEVERLRRRTFPALVQIE